MISSIWPAPDPRPGRELGNDSTSAQLDKLNGAYNPRFAGADTDFDDACFGLQAIADNNNIVADLRCG